MGKRLYVGSLPYDTTESGLRELFAGCGVVSSIRLIADKATGAARGFAFVDMFSDSDAHAAIRRLDGSRFNGRRIVVNEARPPAGRR